MRRKNRGRGDLIGPRDGALRDLPVLHLELARRHQGTLVLPILSGNWDTSTFAALLG